MRHLLATDCFPKITPLHWNPRLSSRKSHRCGWSWKPGRTNPGCPHPIVGVKFHSAPTFVKNPRNPLLVCPAPHVGLQPIAQSIGAHDPHMMTLDDSWYDQWWCFQFFSGDDLPFRLRFGSLEPSSLGRAKATTTEPFPHNTGFFK